MTLTVRRSIPSVAGGARARVLKAALVGGAVYAAAQEGHADQREGEAHLRGCG